MNNKPKKLWSDIVRDSDKYKKETQYVISEKLDNKYIESFNDPLLKEKLFREIWCWGEYELLNHNILYMLTIEEIYTLIYSINEKMQEIEGWDNEERDRERLNGLIKCRNILKEQNKIKKKYLIN